MLQYHLVLLYYAFYMASFNNTSIYISINAALLLIINWGSPLLITLSVKSCSDLIPKLRLVNLFYALYAFCCPIQHVLVESARSAGEISKAREGTIVYILARC